MFEILPKWYGRAGVVKQQNIATAVSWLPGGHPGNQATAHLYAPINITQKIPVC